MKQFLLLFTLFFNIILKCNSQLVVDQDTFEPILKGNTILYGSSKIGHCNVLGYSLTGFKSEGCNGSNKYEGKEAFSDINGKDNSLLITIMVNGNCGHHFLGEMEAVEDSILNIICHGYGELERCDCIFCLNYTINYSPGRVKMASERSNFNLKYAMINGNRKTLRNIEKLLIKK
jgi:hypothetical protein